jgi:NTE family protein
MHRAITAFTLWAAIFLLTGCAGMAARFPDNPRLEHAAELNTRSGLENRGSGEVLMVLTFSGGGSRAAALAYGVLEALRDTPVKTIGQKQTMLGEIDMISAVSGGSITAAYFGLFGDRLFTDFRGDFLERDVGGELKDIVLSAGTLARISSETFGTGDVLDEYFHHNLFGSASVGELVDEKGPFVRINATDLFKGGQFGFTADQFALICSDIDQFPVSRAVAASSAVPLIFSPIVLTNHAGSCNYTPPAWLKQGLLEEGKHNRRYRIARNLNTYLDREAHPYIHLVDGGLADNLGLRAVMDYIVIEGGLWNALKRFKLDDARDIVIISVDASALLPSEWEQSAAAPSNMAIIDAATTTPLVNNNFETLEYLHSNLSGWRQEIVRNKCKGVSKCAKPEVYHIKIHLEDIADPELRKRLTSVPTDFTLDPTLITDLIDAGHKLLHQHPEYQKFIQRTWFD